MVNNNNNRLKFEIGEQVFIVLPYGDMFVTDVEIQEVNERSKKYEVREHGIGEEHILNEEDMYETKQEAHNRMEELREESILEGMEKLKTVKDLVEFCEQEDDYGYIRPMYYVEEEVVKRKIEEFDRIIRGE